MKPRWLVALSVTLAACSAPSGRAGLTATTAATPIRSSSVTATALSPMPDLAPPTATAAQFLPGADPTNATAVGAAFARLSWTVDTSSDTGEVAAEARLAALMTPQLAAQVEAAVGVLPGATFLLWRSHRATTEAGIRRTFDSGAPPDSLTTAYRSFAITVVPTGRDGWAGPAVTEIEFLTLTRPTATAAWLVAGVA